MSRRARFLPSALSLSGDKCLNAMGKSRYPHEY